MSVKARPASIAATSWQSTVASRSQTAGATLAPTFRYMSGAPFTIFNSNVDADRNGELERSVAGRHRQRHGDQRGAVMSRTRAAATAQSAPTTSSWTCAPAGAGVSEAHAGSKYFRHLQRHQPRELRQSVGRRTGERDVPRASRAARRRRIPATGGVWNAAGVTGTDRAPGDTLQPAGSCSPHRRLPPPRCSFIRERANAVD